MNVGTCQFLDQNYGPWMANASILMKLCTLNKLRVTNSMGTKVFCDSWRLSNLTLLSIGIFHLLGHIFKLEFQELQFGEILYSAQIRDAKFSGDNSFLWHKFGRRTANASIVMKLCILHKSKALNSMVTIAFCNFWRPPVKFDIRQFWHR